MDTFKINSKIAGLLDRMERRGVQKSLAIRISKRRFFSENLPVIQKDVEDLYHREPCTISISYREIKLWGRLKERERPERKISDEDLRRAIVRFCIFELERKNAPSRFSGDAPDMEFHENSNGTITGIPTERAWNRARKRCGLK